MKKRSALGMSLSALQKYCVPYVLTVLLVGLVSFGSSYLVSALIRDMFDRVGTGTDMHDALRQIGLYCGAYLLLTAASLLAGFGKEVLLAHVGHDQRTRLFKRLQALPLSFFDQSNTNSFAMYFETDLTVQQRLYAQDYPRFCTDFCILAGSITVTLLWQWELGLLYLAAAAFLLWFNTFYGKRIKAQQGQVIALRRQTYQKLGDTFQGIKEVKTFDVKGFFLRELGSLLEKSEKTAAKLVRLNSSLGAWGIAASRCGFVLVIAAGCLLVAMGRTQLGTVLAVAVYLFGYAYTFRTLSLAFANIAGGFVSVRRLGELSQHPTEQEEKTEYNKRVLSDKSTAFCPEGAALFLDSVTYRYPKADRDVFRDFTFSAAAGELVGVRGESGCGKSTLLKLIAGLYMPADGHIWIGGKRLCDCDLKEWRKSVFLLTQDTELLRGTVLENILCANPESDRDAAVRAAEQSGADAFIRALPQGYDTVLDPHGGQELSGGERQRLGLARAFVSPAKLILLDEPTAALDAAAEEWLLECIRSGMQDRLCVLVSHRPSTLKWVSRILNLAPADA